MVDFTETGKDDGVAVDRFDTRAITYVCMGAKPERLGDIGSIFMAGNEFNGNAA